METQNRLDLEAIRAKLAGKSGKRYWRSLEEVADTEEFQKFVEDEFPNRSSLLQMDRRSLLKFMGASLAVAGLSGCRGVFMPVEHIVPYVKAPEEMVPGKSLYYASSVLLAGYATGVLVEQREGRPIKLEGNPEHPASLGSLDSFGQAEILSFYDPDRLMNVVDRGEISTWELFLDAARDALKVQKAKQGQGIRILTGAVTSPTLGRLLDAFKKEFPGATWHSYEAAGLANVATGAELVYGKPLSVSYDFAKAKAVVSLDSDFLSPAEGPGSLRYARDFANGRRVSGSSGEMNRLYAFDSTPSITGVMADHRFPVRPSQVHDVAAKLLAGVLGSTGDLTPELIAIVEDLRAHRGASIVVAGPHQSAEVHALALSINQALGNIGNTVITRPSVEKLGASNLQSLQAALNADKVDLLFVFGANPVYDAPADLEFAKAITKAKSIVYHGTQPNETSDLAGWVLPGTHTLEAWGDGRAFDGTASIIQPIIAPIYGGRSEIEILAALLGKPLNGYDLVRATWQASGQLAGDFEKKWREAVHDGTIPNTRFNSVTLPARAVVTTPKPAVTGMEIGFRPDPTVHDGRFANNGWLQELPKPLSKLTWDNAAILSVKTAANLKVQTDDLVKVTANGVDVTVGVFVLPGQPDDVVTLHLGYGRTKGGTLAVSDDADEHGGGVNAYLLRTSETLAYGPVEVVKVPGVRHHAGTQGHSPLEDSRITDSRDIMRWATLAEFNEDPKAAEPAHREMDSEKIRKQNLFPEEIFEWNGPQWGMTIDMNTCIGCNACVTACQAENNIPVVGKVQVMRHREMHWIRLDRYWEGDSENPMVNWQPVMCVHCEKAPCEPVCPVAATVHSHEGLNQMVYNRCVGTRYCSNNCPYKVRRFNYLNYSDNQHQFAHLVTPWKQVGVGERLVPGPIHAPKDRGIPLLRLLNNPDVTVRGRGIMEKCTYCVQRINEARIEAKKLGRDVADGEIVTACQQACPTQTIVFGDIADPESAVSRTRKDPRSYLLLENLQTRPRTSHLAKLRNPNPALNYVSRDRSHDHHGETEESKTESEASH
ncbi:MAG: TAT-variant-translocated molybdopterin oxidoreductase [Fimbriimonas sp.]